MTAWNVLIEKEAANTDQADYAESNAVKRETQIQFKWMRNFLHQESKLHRALKHIFPK